MNRREVKRKFVEDIWEGQEMVLVNGAKIFRSTPDCAVCTERNEEVEPGVYTVELGDNQIRVCKAHAQELLDANSDEAEKGGVFEEVFGKKKA